MLGKEQPWKWREIHRIVERKPRCHGPKRAIPVPVYGLPIESGEGISMNYIEWI